MADYPTTAELVALSVDTSLTNLSSDEQDALRESAIAAIEEFANQRFESRVETVTIDGYGSDVLYLPQRLETLTGLSIEGTAWPVDSVVLNSQNDRLSKSRESGIGYYEQAMAEVSGERFPLGFGNVALTGTWGWTVIPEAVEWALVWDMEDTAIAEANALSGTIRAYRKLGVRTIDQGNLRADVTGTPTVSDRVARLLRPYVWQGAVGALA